MKHVLLLFTLLPLAVFAHRDDPRERKEAPYAGVKSVKTTTFFSLPKENNKLDTCSVETDMYNTGGWLTQHDFSMIMQKNPWYTYRETFSYSDTDAWTQRTYKRGVLTDSASVNGSWANSYAFYDGKPQVLHEYRGDSLQEKLINGTDTVYWAKKLNKYVSRDEFWDYSNAGPFGKISVSRSIEGPDTVSYLDAAGKCLVKYVTYYNRSGNTAKIDYYNYGIKTFEFKRLAYSEKMNMTFFLEKNSKGNWSYEVLYTYNDRGQLTEERWIDANPKRNQVVKKYEYVFY